MAPLGATVIPLDWNFPTTVPWRQYRLPIQAASFARKAKGVGVGAEEVAALAVYLASDAATYVTGSTFHIDWGMMRHSGML